MVQRSSPMDGPDGADGAGQTVRLARRRISGRQVQSPAYQPYLWPFSAMIVLSAVGIILIVAFDSTAEEVGKQLLPASIVGLTVAGTGAMLNSHMASRSAAEAARERVLREVVRARELLDAAHLVIQADGRVETYRDQILELVRAQGSLRVARALVQSTNPAKQVFEVEYIGVTLQQVYTFVGNVTEEYRETFMEVARGKELKDFDSLPWLQRFLDPPTFETEVQLRLRDAVKSIQVSSGGIRTTTPSPGRHGHEAYEGPAAPRG